MSSEWCRPTAVLPNQSLARLLTRARRTTSTPAVEPRERRERTSIPKLETPAPVYPVYRGSSRIVWWIGGLAAVIAGAAALVIV